MRHANIALFVPHAGCPHRCSFCAQYSITGQQQVPDAEMVRETCKSAMSDFAARGQSPRTAEIAFFGGSFTAIDRRLMIALLAAAAPFTGGDGFHGIRVSTRPDAVDTDILALLRAYGVTAIELGTQSMDDGVLQKNLRGHTARQVEDAAGLIHASGFELGLQMMTGLYSDTEEKSAATAERLAALCPDTVRIYPAVVLRDTLLAKLYERGLYAPPPLEETVRQAAALLQFFEERGIRVIRLGLHASAEVERDFVAGGYHPALRELCEAELYWQAFARELEREDLPQGGIVITVARGAVSKAVGQRRCNLERLSRLGFHARVQEDEALTGRAFLIRAQTAKGKGE